MKKKLSLLIKIIVLICLIFLLILVIFFNNTYSIIEIDKYCKDKSWSKPVNFEYNWSETPVDTFYMYCVNSSPEKGKSQELFVFKEQPFLFVKRTSHYKLISQSVNDKNDKDNRPVGSLLYTKRDSNNKKLDTNTLAFFSSNSQEIVKMKYELKVNDKIEKHEETIARGEPFVIEVENLGIKNNVTTKFVKAKFYNYENELVYEINE